jgi:hypothetical protein
MLPRTIAVASVALLFATSGDAATYFVAANGSATAACSFNAPCQSLAQALFVAGVGDTIVCVSSPGASSATITKSITIDCSSGRAPVRDIGIGSSPVLGVSINIPVTMDDPSRTVRLRGLDVDGARFYDRGIDIAAATVVYIEDCVVSNAKQQGIYDHRTGGQTKLFIKDSIFSGNGGPGIALGSQGPNTNVLDNVLSEYNAYGLAAAAGNNVLVNRSVMSGNSVAGVEADTGAQVVVNNSAISHNNIGVQSNSSVRLSNDDIAFNNLALSGMAGTFGNNRLSGNSAVGTAPMPLGSASQDLGQQ